MNDRTSTLLILLWITFVFPFVAYITMKLVTWGKLRTAQKFNALNTQPKATNSHGTKQ